MDIVKYENLRMKILFDLLTNTNFTLTLHICRSNIETLAYKFLVIKFVNEIF